MQLTTNTRAFIEAEQYSSFILTNMHDGLLPQTFYRDVSDFGSGTTLHIKTIGDVSIQDAAEDVALEYSPIDTGEVTLQITDYVGDAWFIVDDLREDGAQVEQLAAARSAESTRALQERFESRYLEVCEAAQTDADPNKVNGFAHRIASADTNGKLELSDLIKMKLAFDKAEVPMAGRVAIMDPICAAHLDQQVSITNDVTPFAEQILQNGFDREHEFLMNLYGWNIMTSNRLAKGTFSDGTTSISDGVANVFMCVADDNTKPIMAAWRRMPSVEGERNKDLRRDEFVTTSRYGFGPQRKDTLGIYITTAVNI
ncbi:major capsid protein [Salinivibrio phage CW02]|uniref:Major capsid protein n=1 Tax=Salinivibrio phage CW02 TaxID=1161935 RepID=H9D1H2_9CAUD|nr:major capsid protein [Salinivibrio phage CW02]AFE86214.1 major capsid protein [Salinivibrio phage CW02]